MLKPNPRTNPKSILLFSMVIFLVSIWTLIGCSTYYTARRTTKKIARDIMINEEDLKKSIAIIKFENQTYYTNDKIDELFQSKITETLQSACTNIHLILPGDERYPKPLKAPPRLSSGRIDNLKLVQVGRLYGLGAIATGSINNVSAYQEKRGLFWLRDDHTYLQVQIHLEVFDTETGAKLLDENRLEEVEIEEDDYHFIKEKRQVPIVEISEEVQFSATLLGEKICDALANQSWKSYVVSKEGEKVIISSGKNAGLQPGNRFDIYDTGKLINGIGDERFLLPGKKVGVIQVTYVHMDKAETVVVKDEGIRPGDIVKQQ
ncbi:MAG: hypothetical protein H8E81_09595 [Deltaproteobacteria bacterium]|nr:hypothetical protein [Deltaproteobacteria bacterium]